MTTPTDADAAAPSAPTTTTTRACIKNLPPSFDEAKLKRHLQRQSPPSRPPLRITDCKILKTKDGRSRKIAFVGFQTAEQATSAVEYFDRTFAGTARLSVSLAFSKKRGPPPEGEHRPWSKHSAGSSRYEKLQQRRQEEGVSAEKKNVKSKKEAEVGDAEPEEIKRKREEFLSAMGISASSKQGGKDDDKVSKSKFWANDDVVLEPRAEQTNSNPAEPKEGNMSEGVEDSDSSSSTDESSDSDSEGDAAADDAKKRKGDKDKISDLDFLRSKQVKADILSDDESDDDGKDDSSDSSSESDDSSGDSSGSSSSEDEDDAEEPKGEQNTQQSESSTVAAVAESPRQSEEKKDTANTQHTSTLVDRLFVRNLPFTTTEEDLFETFSQFGHVSSVHIPVDDSKRNKGYAFITFQQNRDAKLAMDTMDGEDFQGRLIHILPARPSADNADADASNLTYKERQALARQKEADKSSSGWSASFLRGDAVVDNLSDRLGVSKGEVLNVKDGISSGNAAVRLALGETHIISENIAFFEEHGVDVTALESKSSKKNGGRSGEPSAKRSKTMILVKNLPYDTSMEDLTKVFHGIGGDVPHKISLPPSKTAALVEYGHATDARRAFRRLAYKKFKHVPLYLEWAPMRAGERESAETEGDDVTKDVPRQESSDAVAKRGLADEDPSAEAADVASQTVYVKNLNFSTSEDQLNSAFTKAGFHPRAVKIPTKAAPIKKSRKGSSSAADSSSNVEMRPLSMGFGFVEFPSEEEALKAMKTLQGKLVDGHALEIKLSTKSLSSSKPPAAGGADESSKNTKIMVRNVPFEATRTELLKLFGSFGQLKRVRLPKKFDGTHRGFAFCEFVTSKEARNAMASLSRTHLYGRHLVLEWAAAAEEDENVAGAARERAKRDAMRAGLGGTKGGGKKGKHLKFS